MKNTRPVIDPRGRFTFVMIPRWILRSKLSFGAKCLYGIAMSMHARSSEHWPTAKEIADELNISVHTVKAHLAKLYERLQTGNRMDTVMEAIRLGLIDG